VCKLLTYFLKKNKFLKSIFKKIKKDIFKSLTYSKSHSKDINKLLNQQEISNQKIARLEGAMSVLLSKSQSQRSLKRKYETIETKAIKHIRKNKRNIILEQIKKLMPSYSIIEIKNIIVDEKGLCSKASFYRYISSLSLKSQSHKIETIETN